MILFFKFHPNPLEKKNCLAGGCNTHFPPKNMCVKITSSPLVSMMKIKHHVNDYHHLVWMIELPQLLTFSYCPKLKKHSLTHLTWKIWNNINFNNSKTWFSRSNNLNFLKNHPGIQVAYPPRMLWVSSNREVLRGAWWYRCGLEGLIWTPSINEQLALWKMDPKIRGEPPFHHLRNFKLPSKKMGETETPINHPTNNLCYLAIFRGPRCSHVTVGVYGEAPGLSRCNVFRRSFRLKMGGYSSLLC